MLDKKTVIGGLRLIFWGALLCVLDVSINDFDVLNDVVGMLLITWGVFRLGTQDGGESYRKALVFVKIAAVVGTAYAIVDQFPVSLGVFGNLISLLILAGIYVFCRAMTTLARHHGLHRSTASWRTTGLLFLVIYIVPLGILTAITLALYLGGPSSDFQIINDPLLALPLLAVLLLPVVHLFISTSRMRNEVDDLEPGSGISEAAFQNRV